MNPFDATQRNVNIRRLDQLTNAGRNCVPYKTQFIDDNTINLDLGDPIYRIFNLDNFRLTLRTQRLCLVRPSEWEDPFENFLLNSQGILPDGTRVGFSPIRDQYYGQCWTLRRECDGLWRNYRAAATAAIKVKTTVEKLMNAFYDLSNRFHELSYFIGKVDYSTDEEIENFFQDELDILHFNSGVEFVQSLLIKRTSFDYEREVRIIFNKPVSDEIDLTTIHNPWDDTNHFLVQFDPNILIEEIEIDPWLSQPEFERLRDEFINLGYHGRITQSTLYNRPFFVARIR